MRRRGFAACVAGVLLAAACARRIPVPIPEAVDYLYPDPRSGELSSSEVQELRRAWSDVLAADSVSAVRRLDRLKRAVEARPSVLTALAYAQLRAERLDEAERVFTSALAAAPEYVPALVGSGSTASRRGDVDAALGFYRRAAAVSPAEGAVRKRLAALKLQVTERHIGRAQVALAAEDLATAVAEYGRALDAAPEVADVRLALADLQQRSGDPVGALATLAADPGGDRQLKLRRAGLLVTQQQFESALAVYRELLARDPADEAARAGEALARERFEAFAMPEEYRRIPDAPQLTRADLAALVVVKVKALRRVAPGESKVAIDIAGSWAREQIVSALTLDVMDVYPNHTFQPGAVVRRVDVARTAGRILERLGWPRATAPAPSDMPRSHLDYDAVQRALGAGLLGLTETGAFEPWRPVTGREALEVVEALSRLLGP